MSPVSLLSCWAANGVTANVGALSGPSGLGALVVVFLVVVVGNAVLGKLERDEEAYRFYCELCRAADWKEMVARHLEVYDTLFALADPTREAQIRENASEYREAARRARADAERLKGWRSSWRPAPEAAARPFEAFFRRHQIPLAAAH